VHPRTSRHGGDDRRPAAAGRSTEEIPQAYPYLEREDIQAALAYAALRAQEIEVALKAS
jgi:uncharacterized protein (DUF433 family)